MQVVYFCFTESTIYEHELFRSSVKNVLPFLLELTHERKTKHTVKYLQWHSDLSLRKSPWESLLRKVIRAPSQGSSCNWTTFIIWGLILLSSERRRDLDLIILMDPFQLVLSYDSTNKLMLIYKHQSRLCWRDYQQDTSNMTYAICWSSSI